MIDKECIEKLCNDAKEIMLVTSKGCYVVGTKLDVMTLFALLVDNLCKNGLKPDELRHIVDIETKETNTDKIEDMLEKMEKFSEMLKKMKEEN